MAPRFSKAELRLKGLLGSDPDVRQSTTGKSVVKLRIATSQGRGRPDIWWYVVAWEGLAEFIGANFRTGDIIDIALAYPTYSEWDWKKDDGTVVKMSRMEWTIRSLRTGEEEQEGEGGY